LGRAAFAGDQQVKPVTIYTTRWCPFCVRAKQLLSNKSVSFTEISVDGDAPLRAKMAAMAGATSVPQIWIGDQHVGGCDELYGLERQQRLDSMLQEEA
jgi:glutaredoxin 3